VLLLINGKHLQCYYRKASVGSLRKYSILGTPSLRTQTYFWLSLVSIENNVCKPEPGNDFCDVMIFVSPWPIRFHDRMKLECSSQQIPCTVVLGLLELNCDWLEIPTSQKSFSGSGSQTLFLGETSDSWKYVCVHRLGNTSHAIVHHSCLEFSQPVTNAFWTQWKSVVLVWFSFSFIQLCSC